MKLPIRVQFKGFILILLLFAGSFSAKASHFYGSDFYYTWISGNTYRITLDVYGDCGGNAFPFLATGSPQVQVINMNNNSIIATTNLLLQGPGVEVTPVCPAQASNTICRNPNSVIPGVKKFTYSLNYTLPSFSTNWKFRFTGDMNNNSNAGRSASITNILSGTITSMESTLNNSVAVGGSNSSPVYTTIPTPFFCINKPANYNPGAVDANGDALFFSLVPGLVQTPVNGIVTYVNPSTAAQPLLVSPATFSFSTTNGQLSFTPNASQQALIVGKVSEYRNNVLVGTSMREMTFVVLPNCNNNPPGGNVGSPSIGVTVNNTTTVSVCKSQGFLNFNIVATDLDGNNMDLTYAGLPAGATLTIVGNNTNAPVGTFNWNLATAAPGVYNFFVTYQDDGCPLSSKQTLAYTINVYADPSIGFNLLTPVTCLGKAKYTLIPGISSPWNVTILQGTTVVQTITGATGPFTDSLAAGTYTFRVKNANNCTHDTTITFAPPVQPAIAANVKRPLCTTFPNGVLSLTASNSQAPYTYALGAGPYTSSNIFTNLAAGTYLLHAKDANGCIKDTSIVLSDSFTITGQVAITNVLCYGGNTGSISLTGAGGTADYTYALNAGPYSLTNTFPNLTAATYTVRVKDANGCIRDLPTQINQPTVLSIAASATNVQCNGNSDATLSIVATGGSAPYQYALDAGSYTSSGTFTGLAAGSYILHARDDNNCIHDTTIVVTQPTKLAYTLARTSVLCNGGNTGTVTVQASGGTPPYLYAADANPYAATNPITGLTAGTHIIHLKDANGCIKDSTITIIEPAVLGISFTATEPICSGNANGTITISGNGGTAPFTYAINANPFVSTPTFLGLAAGSFTLRVKDAKGCTKDTSIMLQQPSSILVSTSIARPRCTPLVNGIVLLYASGGRPGYTYARGAGAYTSSPTFTGLGAGSYVFHIKDAVGCIKDTTILVQDSVFVSAVLNISAVKCFGESNGSMEIFPAGGDAPYLYHVNTNPYAATNPIVNLAASNYVLYVKDSNGCVLDTNVTVTQPSILVPGTSLNRPLCFGDSTGSIFVSTIGGTPPYEFAKGSGPYTFNGNFVNLPIGTYTFHIRDGNGCQHDTTVTLTQPSPLAFASVAFTNVLCFGDNSGTATLFGSGGTPPYAYNTAALPYNVSNIVTGLNVGYHVLHVKDANGCIKDTSVTLTQPTQLYFSGVAVTTATCEGFKDGKVVLNGFGGTPTAATYLYSADNITFKDRNVFPSLGEGPHTFYIKDSNNCVHDTMIVVPGYPHIVINNPKITEPNCYGEKNGAITMNVSGGNAPLTYQMLKPSITNTIGTFDTLRAGSYTIRVQDAKGCNKDTTVLLVQPDSLDVILTVTGNDCLGLNDGGGAMAKATGGTQPYRYAWSNGATGEQTAGLPNGPIKLLVTDSHNCSDTVSGKVEYDNCCTPFIPTAFTPNGDGRNDVFRVAYKGDVSKLELNVFNRYGEKVFATYRVDGAWDGTYHGKPAELGTYFYYIKFICGNGGDNRLEFKGDVTLVR